MKTELIFDGPLSGQQNMDRDAELLEHALHSETSTLRFYQWESPTISLGHFQVTQDANIPERFANLDCVKRLSGGGAILHHHELTYSCALPKTHSLREKPSQLYHQIHDVIVQILERRGVQSHLRGDAAFQDKSFLCFSRGDERDIVIGTNKIVGSAQRRRQGAILQHGSILLEQSPYAPEFPGIQELTGISLDPEQLAQELAPEILKALSLETT